jgi:hypothetical protein
VDTAKARAIVLRQQDLDRIPLVEDTSAQKFRTMIEIVLPWYPSDGLPASAARA